MSNSNLLTFRCPDDLREAIADLMADTSKDRTAVVTMLLRLGIAAYNSGQTDVVRGEPGVTQAQAVPIEETVQTIVASMLQGVQQRLTEVEQRLGEFERLKADDALRLADRDLAKAVAMKCQVDSELRQAKEEIQSTRDERDRLDERVSDLLLEVENLKDENAVLKQAATDAGRNSPQPSERLQQPDAANEVVQNCPPLEEIRDRVLNELKVGKQSAIYKAVRAALNQFIKDIESFQHLWRCWAVNERTGEQRLIVGGYPSEKECQAAAIAKFSQYDFDPFPTEDGWKIVYRQN